MTLRLGRNYTRGLHFVVEEVDSDLTINVDPQFLASAVMNLLNNAFKYTRPGGRIVLRAYREDRRVRIEVEDECGGIPDSRGDPFQTFADRRGDDRSGLALGLSIARKAVRAHGGDIHIRNKPGMGCVFVIEVPLAGEYVAVPPAPNGRSVSGSRHGELDDLLVGPLGIEPRTP